MEASGERWFLKRRFYGVGETRGFSKGGGCRHNSGNVVKATTSEERCSMEYHPRGSREV